MALVLIVAGGIPSADGATFQAEFPNGTPDGAASWLDEPPGPGSDIMITNGFDNRITVDPDDGSISIYEARGYAHSDLTRNRVYFWRGFGRVTLSGSAFTLHGPEDVFLGFDQVMTKIAGWWDAGGFQGVFVNGLIEVTGTGRHVQNCYFGLEFDKVTPATQGGTVSVTGTKCQVHDNLFCGSAWGVALGVSGEENWVYANTIGLRKDLLTPQPELPETGIWVGGKNNRIGDRADASNHICTSGTGIVVTGQGHTIRANYVGPNNGERTGAYGIEVRPPSSPEDGETRDNYIGGPDEPGMAHNVITHFTEAGVYFHPGCNYNGMGGNHVGIYQTGKPWGPPGKYGVAIGANTIGNEIGGSSPLYRNWIGDRHRRVSWCRRAPTRCRCRAASSASTPTASA